MSENSLNVASMGVFARASEITRPTSVVSTVSADVLDVYLHQSQVVLLYSSTYLFNQVRKLFDTLYLALRPRNPSYKAEQLLKEWGVVRSDWEWLGWKRIGDKQGYAVLNKRYRIVIYSKHLNEDMPVSITFLDDRAWGRNNTITFSKIFNSMSTKEMVGEKPLDPRGKCMISINFAGYVLDYWEFIERLKPILPPKKKFDFEKGLIKIRPVRQEVYVRYAPDKEFEVKKMIDELHRRFGYDKFFDIQQIVGDKGFEKERVQYLASARVIFALPNHYRATLSKKKILDFSVKLYVKTYRRERFRHPEEDYSDWPKLEIAVYFNENDSPKDVEKKIKFAGELLASLAHAVELDVVYSDYYKTLAFSPAPEWVRFFKGKLLLENLTDLKLKPTQKMFLKYLANGILWSSDLHHIAVGLGVSIKTVQRHIKELIDMGLVLRIRTQAFGKPNQYAYFLNLSAISDGKIHIVNETEDLELKAFTETVKCQKAVPEEVKRNSRLIITWYLVVHGFRTVKAIHRKLQDYGIFVTDRTVRNYLQKLIKCGLVEVSGTGPYTTYKAKYLVLDKYET